MTPQPDHLDSPEWRRILEQGDHFRHWRRWLRLLPSDPRCELCRAPFAGAGGAVLRAVKGIKPSTLNPRYCNDCELIGTEYPGGAETNVAMLFVDIRGSTTLAQDMTPAAFTAVIDRFYRVASDVLIEAGALIEKLIGDEVTAIFAPGFAGEGYVREAIDAGSRLLDAGAGHDSDLGVPVGAGVHAGRAFVGAVGQAGRLMTISALGDTVNVAARLASMAGPGEMLVSDDAYRLAGMDEPAYPARLLDLRGRTAPVGVRVVTAAHPG
ncbi:MAG TPA: adenylate/guanylate cyclase domain-containing protein [Euzebyales bacterium]|nr:adenylate/guanylate cyclase domain-containing protein [Euzebyales bacterium]